MLIVAGDGWTPLMAAAVADRRNVGEMLLSATGNELGLGFTQKGQPLMFVDSTVFEEADKLKDLDAAFVNDSHVATVTSPTNSKPVLSHGGTLSCVGLAENLNAIFVSQQQLRLLNRQNRYGQTALHIAAQKGSVWFIERLLSAGASLDVPNAYGLRAVDVAKKYKHTAIADKLRAWESSQEKEASISGGKKSRKARRDKGKFSRVANVDQDPTKPTVDCRDANATTLDRQNSSDHSDGIQSLFNVADVQEDLVESITDWVLLETDENPGNGARSDPVVHNVLVFDQDAIQTPKVLLLADE